jgi:hypothetical protein
MAASNKPLELLNHWLQRQLTSEAWNWLSQTVDKLVSDAADRDLYLAVSLVPRKTGKSDLVLSADHFKAADTARTGWRPEGWTVDQAARLVLMLAASPEATEFDRRLEQLCVTADVHELVAFYQGLPLYPEPDRYVGRAAEGLRSNMKSVFESVAHGNPYPQEYFDQGTWNQMVLKAIFVGSTLDPIEGLDRRRNEDLAQTLIDYAHERWAANRVITPELWRMVGPYADAKIVDELRRPLESDLLVERQAAVLALRDSSYEEARALRKTASDIDSDIEAGHVTWKTVANNAPKS